MSTIGMGAGDSAYVVVVVIGAIFALSRIMSIRFSPQFLLLAIALTCLGVIEFYISRRTTLLLTVLLLVSAKEIQPRLLIGTFLAAKIIGLCLVVALVITGIYGVETHQYFKMATGTYIQRVLVNGSSTTIMHLSFLAIIFLSFYMKKGRCGLVYYLGFFFLNLICANITGSYMGFLLGIGGLVLFWICQHVNKFRELLVKYSTAVLPLLLLLTFGTAFLFGHSSAVDAIDRLFQGRVYYNHYFMSNYSVSLFGYGMLSDEKFYEKAQKFALLKDTDDKYYTFDEYKTLIEAEQTDKDKMLIYIYATDRIAQYNYIEAAKNKGYSVLLMDGQLDVHFIGMLEQKFEKSRFVRVDSDIVENLVRKEEKAEVALSPAQRDMMTSIFKSQIPAVEKAEFMVMFEAIGETGHARQLQPHCQHATPVDPTCLDRGRSGLQCRSHAPAQPNRLAER